jgi:tyrosine-protein kinase Etk/Wzc
VVRKGKMSTEQEEMGMGDLDPVNLLIALWKNKLLISIGTGVTAVLSVIYALSLPNIYEATAVVIPPQQADTKYSAMLGQLSSIPFMNLKGNAAVVEPVELLKAYLFKRENVLKVIKKFDLRRVYEFKENAFAEDVIGKYKKHLQVKESKLTGLLKVQFEDKSPKRAQEVVNYNLDLMQSISKQNELTENQKKKKFVTERFEESKAELEAVEKRIRDYFVSKNLIDVAAQTRATIEAVSRLQSEVLVLNSKLQVQLELGTNENHPEVRSLKYQIRALEAQIRQIEKGEKTLHPTALTTKDQSIELMTYLPLSKVPDLRLDIERMMREKLVLQEVFKTLSQEKELARIEASKDQEMIEVIERAHLPERKSKPRRSVICIVWTLTGLFFSCFWVLGKKELKKLT